MKYVIGFLLGMTTAFAMTRIPHYEWFRDQPGDPVDWTGPKMSGAWTEEEKALMNRYWNGGVG